MHGRTLRLLSSAKNRALKSGVEFSLTYEWLKEKIEAGACEVSKLPFSFDARPEKRRKNPLSPSIDRRVAGGPYSPENCQVVVWSYNCAKTDGTHEELMALAEALCTHAKK